MNKIRFTGERTDLGHIRMFPGRKYPFIHAFATDKPLAVITEDQSVVSETAALLSRILHQKYRNLKSFIFDPIGYGTGFDIPEGLKNKFYSNTDERKIMLDVIRERMQDVHRRFLTGVYRNSHLEKFISQTPDCDEKIYVLFVNGFPYRWPAEDAQFLADLLRVGPRSGIYPVIFFNPTIKPDKDLPTSIVYDMLAQCCTIFNHSDTLELVPSPFRSFSSDRTFIEFQFNETKLLTKRVPVEPEDEDDEPEPQAVSRPEPVRIEQDVLSNLKVKSAQDGSIIIPIGRQNTGELHSLVFDLAKDHNHLFITGHPGSGKTNLLHNIMLFGALTHSAETIEFQLINHDNTINTEPFSDIPAIHVQNPGVAQNSILTLAKFIEDTVSARSALLKKHGVSAISDLKPALMPSRVFITIDNADTLTHPDTPHSAVFFRLLQDLQQWGHVFGLHLIVAAKPDNTPDNDLMKSAPLIIALRYENEDKSVAAQGQAIAYAADTKTHTAFNTALADGITLDAIRPVIKARQNTKKPNAYGIKALLEQRQNRRQIVIGLGENNTPASMILPEKGRMHTAYAAHALKDLLLHTGLAAGQMMPDAPVGIFCDAKHFKALNQFVARTFGKSILTHIDSIAEFVRFAQQKATHVYILAADSFELTALKDTKRSVVSEALCKIMTGEHSMTLHIGFQSRAALAERFDLKTVLTRMSHILILSDKTGTQNLFKQTASLSLPEGIALHIDRKAGTYLQYKKLGFENE